jgi:hypothetical protein
MIAVWEGAIQIVTGIIIFVPIIKTLFMKKE